MMRSLISMLIMFVISCAIASVSFGAVPASKIKFERRLIPSFDLAIKEKKLLVLYFFKPFCTWCQKLDREVFASERIVEFGKRAIFVRLNINALTADEEEVKDLFNGKSVPFVLVFKVTEEEVKKLLSIHGYSNRDNFLSVLEKGFALGDVRLPKRDDKPKVPTGRFTSKDTNVCPPGNKYCNISKELRDLTMWDLFPPKKTAGDRKSPPKSKRATSKRLTHEALERMVKTNWKDAQRNGEGTERNLSISAETKLAQGEGAIQFSLQFSITPNGETVWVSATLTHPLDVRKVPSPVLWRLLTLSNDVGRPKFYIDSKDQMAVSMSLDANTVTAERLKQAADDIVDAVGQADNVIVMVAMFDWRKSEPKKGKK